MKLPKLAALVCACAFLFAACATAPDTNTTSTTNTPPTTGASPAAPAPTPADQLAETRKLFGQVCARCHGDKGEGGEFDLDGKKLKAPSLRTGHAVKHTDAELTKKIEDGDDGMPAFKKRLTPEQISSLVSFIRKELQAGASADTH